MSSKSSVVERRIAPPAGLVRAGAAALLAWAWAGPVPARAQAPQEPAKAAETAKDAPPAAPAEDDAPKEAVDPSASQKAASLVVFKDPNIEAIRDPKKFQEIRANPVQAQEINQLKAMAASPITPADQNVINNVVGAMVAQMSSPRNIQAALDPSGEKNLAVVTAVQTATQNLLEPVFSARAAKNAAFQAKYNQALLQKLPPLLKHHFVPRIQAMIILAQSANPEALKVLLDEIKSPTQTYWVKLWAFRGVTNIKVLTNRLSAAQEADAAKTIADQLLKGKDWPGWVQFRALEALAALRQGFLPSSPRTADMASAAFQYLTDEALGLDVRAEAARALGSMQIGTAVPKYSQTLVAYATARLAATMLDKIADGHSENPLRSQELTATLVGPVFQAFEGQEGARESGLLNSTSGAVKTDVQKYFDALKTPAKAAAALAGAPAGQIEAARKDLRAKVDAFKAFLDKNAPADGTLFPNGPALPAPAAAEPAKQAEAAPKAEAGAPRG
ncbi:MAG: hypothetical protein BGO49_29650 [Planctomycetales bacterium 71-10]|nr:MAG: hypothetical protein BGO49_29650 [Planctomycetales bacterium 71-10]